MKEKTKKLALPILTSIILMLILVYSPRLSAQPANGTVTLTFDDGLQSQYDYAWPLLKAKGMTATFYVTTDDVDKRGFLTVLELQNLQSNGNEIASHSKTHPSFTGISDAQIQQECSVSKQVLQSYGLTINNFAYPYGECNTHTDSIVSQYYRSARSAYDHPYIMQLPTTQFRLLGTAGGAQTSFSDLKGIVDNVVASDGWAIVLFHAVVPTITGNWQTSTQVFSQFLDYVKSKNVAVLTVNQALDYGQSPTPTPTSSPTPSPSPIPPASISVTITLQPFGLSMQYTLASGTVWTAPATINMWQRTWTFSVWSDGSASLTKTFVDNGNYQITYT